MIGNNIQEMYIYSASSLGSYIHKRDKNAQYQYGNVNRHHHYNPHPFQLSQNPSQEQESILEGPLQISESDGLL